MKTWKHLRCRRLNFVSVFTKIELSCANRKQEKLFLVFIYHNKKKLLDSLNVIKISFEYNFVFFAFINF